MMQTIRELCALRGVSGREDAVRAYILERIGGTGEVYIDPLGNIIVTKKGRQSAKRSLMLCAHMDEVGMLVTCLLDDGYLGLTCVGGIDTAVLLGRQVLVGEAGIPGVIGVKPVHLLLEDERRRLPRAEELCIDIGADSKEEAARHVKPGDVVTFLPGERRMGEALLAAKAIDDRIGCAVLLDLLERELPYDMTFAFTVQEEVGARGASVAAYRVQPDCAVIVETTTAADVAGVEEKDMVCRLGKGAVVPFMDRGTVYDKGLFDLAFSTAKSHSIPIQTKTAVAGGNDAGVIHRTRAGVRCVAVSVPCRYLHAPNVTACRADIQSVRTLVEQLAVEICGREDV